MTLGMVDIIPLGRRGHNADARRLSSNHFRTNA